MMRLHRRLQNSNSLLRVAQLLVILQLSSQVKLSQAALPDAELVFQTGNEALPFPSTWLVTYGLFGATGSAIAGNFAFPPEEDELLCNEANDEVDYQSSSTNGHNSSTTASRLTKQTTFHNSSSSHVNNTNATASNSSDLPPPPNFPLPLYTHNEILVVPRGNCSFQHKALSAQRLGAVGIVIYNTLQSRYGWNDTSQQVIFPVAKNDYECSNGQDSNLPASQLQLDPPRYNASFHNPLLQLDSPQNLCQLSPPSKCASKRCLITGPAMDENGGNLTNTSAANTDGVFTACCAWDISETMNEDASLRNNSEPLHIPAVFLTMAQGEALLSYISSSSAPLNVSIQPRTYPKWNASFFFLWLVGTLAVSLAAWNSAHEYRFTMLKLRQVRQRREQRPRPSQQRQQQGQQQPGGATVMTEASASEHDLDVTTTSPDTALPLSSEPTLPSTSRVVPLPESSSPDSLDDTHLDEPSPELPTEEAAPAATAPATRSTWSGMFQGSPLESMEIEIWHVAIFLIVASTLLFLLFFFKFYRVVVVLYAFGCAGAVSLMVIRPLLERVEQVCVQRNIVRNNNNNSNNSSSNNNTPGDGDDDTSSDADDDDRNQQPTFLHRQVLGDMLGVTWLDIFSAVGGYLWSALWLYVYFTQNDPSRMAFYWISQDVFGVALCVLILSLIKLNSMRIGTVLLVAVFFYDIFFVFLTPYLFDGKSIMVSVATSGGSPAGTADFCEKYPGDHDCRGGNPLPFLFTIPHINDYRGGSSLLGLGDVVLPGILLSFAARLDEARRLLNRHTTLRLPEAPERWYHGYFPPLILAYLVGLLMANCAVVWMQRGQPALLYLVPSCLGTLMVLGRHELKDLWKGPKHLRWADRLVRYVLRRV